MPPTDQQRRVVDHDHTAHGRVIAGPGTGKSWTAIELLQRLQEDHPDLNVGLLTFTRAATSELIKKVRDQGIDWLDPSTIHAYALRVLLHNAGQASLALPLRIPDTWETKTLIHTDLARSLRARGFSVDARGALPGWNVRWPHNGSPWTLTSFCSQTSSPLFATPIWANGRSTAGSLPTYSLPRSPAAPGTSWRISTQTWAV